MRQDVDVARGKEVFPRFFFFNLLVKFNSTSKQSQSIKHTTNRSSNTQQVTHTNYQLKRSNTHNNVASTTDSIYRKNQVQEEFL